METILQKQELVDWLSTVNDQTVLQEINKIKRKSTFNFEEEFAKGITSAELKKKTTEFLKSLPWKK